MAAVFILEGLFMGHPPLIRENFLAVADDLGVVIQIVLAAHRPDHARHRLAQHILRGNACALGRPEVGKGNNAGVGHRHDGGRLPVRHNLEELREIAEALGGNAKSFRCLSRTYAGAVAPHGDQGDRHAADQHEEHHQHGGEAGVGVGQRFLGRNLAHQGPGDAGEGAPRDQNLGAVIIAHDVEAAGSFDDEGRRQIRRVLRQTALQGWRAVLQRREVFDVGLSRPHQVGLGAFLDLTGLFKAAVKIITDDAHADHQSNKVGGAGSALHGIDGRDEGHGGQSGKAQVQIDDAR